MILQKWLNKNINDNCNENHGIDRKFNEKKYQVNIIPMISEQLKYIFVY